MAHDAFIHTVTRPTATSPSLEADLQRFAKPRYQIRALRIFRDASNPEPVAHLWSGISEALASASHVIYLASPQAAASKGWRKEVEYWLTNRDVARLIIVVTDGDISWDDPSSDFDWERTTCMPRSIGSLRACRSIWTCDGAPQHRPVAAESALQRRRRTLAATLHGKSVEDMIMRKSFSIAERPASATSPSAHRDAVPRSIRRGGGCRAPAH